MKKTELKSFNYAFQISRKIIFEVSYYRCGNNTNKYFSTQAEQFNQPKTDYNWAGQAQDDLLRGNTKLGITPAMIFFQRWDCFHLQDLNKEQYSKLLKDIDYLKNNYNYIESDEDFNFYQIREFSKMKIKKFKD